MKRRLITILLSLFLIMTIADAGSSAPIRSTSFEAGSSWGYSLNSESANFDTTTTTPRTGSRSVEARGNGSGSCCSGDTIVFNAVDVSNYDTLLLTYYVRGESSLEETEFARSWVLNQTGDEVTPGDHFRAQGWNEASDAYLQSSGWLKITKLIPASLDQANIRIELGSDNSGGDEGIFVDDVQLTEVGRSVFLDKTGFEPGSDIGVTLSTSSTPSGTFDTTTTDPRTGSYSLEANNLDVTATAKFEAVDVSSTDTGYVRLFGKFPDTYEKDDYFKVWILLNNGSDTVPAGDVTFDKRFFGAEGLSSSSEHWFEGSNLPSGYNRLLIPFPASANTIELRMRMENNAEQFLIDDVQIFGSSDSPSISITSPRDGADTNQNSITVRGNTDRSDVGDSVEVVVGGSSQGFTSVQADSSWSLSGISLSNGSNLIRSKLYRSGSSSSVIDTDVVTVNFNDTNLIFPYNWDMEDQGPGGIEPVKFWEKQDPNDDFTWDDSESLDGSASMALDNLESSFEEVASETVPVQANEPYEVRSSFKVTTNASDKDIRLSIQWLNSSNNVLTTSSSVQNLTGSGSWEQLSFSDSAPSNADKARFLIAGKENTNDNANLNIDQAEFVLDRSIEITQPNDGHDTDQSPITVKGSVNGNVDVGDAVIITVDGSRTDTATVQSDSTWKASSVNLNGIGDSVVANLLRTSSTGSDTVARDTITVNKVSIGRFRINEVSPSGDGSSSGDDWVELHTIESGIIPSGYKLTDDDGNIVELDVIEAKLNTGAYIVVHDSAASSEVSDSTTSNLVDSGDTYWDVYDGSLSLVGTSGGVFLKDGGNKIQDAVVFEDFDNNLDEGAALTDALNAGEWSNEGVSNQEYDGLTTDGTGLDIAYRDAESSDTNSKRGWDFSPGSATMGGQNDESLFNQNTGTGSSQQNFDGIVAAGASGLTYRITYEPSVDFGGGISRRGYIELKVPVSKGYPEPSLTNTASEGFVSIESPNATVSDSFIYSDSSDSYVVVLFGLSLESSNNDTMAFVYGDQSQGGPGFTSPSTGSKTTDTFTLSMDPTGNNVEPIPDSEQPAIVRADPDTVILKPNSASNPAGSLDELTAYVEDNAGNRLEGAELGYVITENPGNAFVADTQPNDGKTQNESVQYDFQTDTQTASDNSLYVFLESNNSIGDTFTDSTTLNSVGDTLVVNEFLVDPETRDHDNDGTQSDEDEEFIQVYNPSSDTINLENWFLEDSDGITMPLKGNLLSSGFLTYFASNASNGNDEIYLYNSRGETTNHVVLGVDKLRIGNLLNNSSDTLMIKTPSGAIVDSISYNSLTSDHSWARKIDGWEVKDIWVTNATPHPGITNQNQSLEGPPNAEIRFNLPDTASSGNSFQSTIWVEGPNGDTVSNFNKKIDLGTDSGTVTPGSVEGSSGVFTGKLTIDSTDSGIVTLSGTYAVTTRGMESIRVIVENKPPDVSLSFPDTGAYVGGENIPGTYVISDSDNESGTVTIEVSDDSGANFDTVATVSGSLLGVYADSNGETYPFEWNSLVDLGKTYDTQVKLRIRATDGEETGPYDTSGAFTVDNLAPPKVTDLESTGSITTPDTGVFLTWTGNGSDGAYFQIYRSEGAADTSKATRIDTVDYRSDTSNYQDQTVTKGDSYFYYVTTVDTAENESDSSAKTTAPVVSFVKRDTGVESYRPGDTLTYKIEVTNKGFGPTDNLELVDAIPKITTLADSADVLKTPPSADIDYSPDNGNTWQNSSFPRKDIDQIRWTITANLDPRRTGSSSVFRFIVRID